MYAYAWQYTEILFPVFVVRSDALFRRVAVAYAGAVLVGFVCFALFPVSAVGFRPEAGSITPDSFASWGLRLLYTLDPPYNLFPSLHLALATLAAFAAWTARPAYGALAALACACIGVSILTVKQHFVVDAAAGLALAVAAWALCIRPYRAPAPRAAAYSWRGPLAYLGFHGLVYLGLYAAYRAGWGPS